MADETRESSTVGTFWGQMDRNSERARQMPDWAKGSTVNHRVSTASAGASSNNPSASQASQKNAESTDD